MHPETFFSKSLFIFNITGYFFSVFIYCTHFGNSQLSQISHRHSTLVFSHAQLVVLASSNVNRVNLKQKNTSAQDKNCNDMCHVWRYCDHYVSSGPYSAIKYRKKKMKRKSLKKQPCCQSHCLTKLPSYHLIKTLKAVKAEKELFCCVQYITSDKRPNSACLAALCSTTSNNRSLKTAKLPEIAFSLLCPSPQMECARSVTQSSI